jgi:hypothetical protein
MIVEIGNANLMRITTEKFVRIAGGEADIAESAAWQT